MSRTYRERIIKAMEVFSPKSMSKHLIRTDRGAVIFDRGILTTDELKAMFYYILNRDYNSGYKNIENTTVYFETINGCIVAGAYDLTTGDKKSRRVLISTNEQVLSRTPYTYTKELLEEFENKIMNA